MAVPNLEYYFTHEDNAYFLWRRTSPAPTPVNNQIYATLGCLFYKGYVVFVKDKTKPFMTLIGGTCNKEEFDFQKGVCNHLSILVRETLEETNNNLDISKGIQFEDIATCHFKTQLFGVKLDDNCLIKYGNIESPNVFLDEIIEMGGEMKFQNNEIDKIVLWKVPEMESVQGKDILEKAKTIKESFSKPQPSFMTVFMPLKKIWNIGSVKKMDAEEMREIGFPPSVQSIDFH